MASTDTPSAQTGQHPTTRSGPAGKVPTVPLSPVRPRRRPALIGLGIALVTVVALAVAWLVQTAGNTSAVVTVAQEVRAGDVIEATDLRTTDLTVDPSLDVIPAGERHALVGKRALVSLLPGQTLPRSAVVDSMTPVAGSALVGVTVTAAQMPSEPLRGGDVVLVVDTPLPQADPPTDPPQSIPATVVSSAPIPDTAQTVINVTVPDDRAEDLAARVATGRIALVLLPAGTKVTD